jgi:acyl-CoA thioesterase
MPDPEPGADLRADTTPTWVSAGKYRLDFPDAWSFRHPSGGALMTAVLRAAQAELDDAGLRIRSATALFASVIDVGLLDIDVRVIRKGGVAAQVSATLKNAGGTEPGLEVVATFARDRDEGPAFIDVERPEVPPPLATEIVKSPTPVAHRWMPPIFRQLEARLAIGQPWWKDDWTPGPARLARWMRYRTPQRLEDGTFDPLSLPPVVDTMPPSAIQRLGPGFTPFVAPSLDLTVHFFEPITTEWLLTDTHTRYAGNGYGGADVHVWDEAGKLVCFATQMWIFRKVPPRFKT